MSEYMLHTNMSYVLSELMLHTKIYNSQTDIAHEYEMYSVKRILIIEK